MDVLAKKTHINVPFEYAECDYNLTRKAHLNGYVSDHTYENLSISEYLCKLILLSYVNVIISHWKYNIHIFIKSVRCIYKLVDKCDGFNKYVFPKNKVLMYIFVNTIVGMNDTSMDNDWKWRHVWYVIRRLTGVCPTSLYLKCVNKYSHMAVHKREMPFICTECGCEKDSLTRMRWETRENNIIHVL